MLMIWIHTFDGDKSVVTKYEQCVLVERPRQPVSETVKKTQNKCKNCNEMVQLLVIRCSAIELHAHNLWGMTGFEPAFPDLKTDQKTHFSIIIRS